MSSANAGDIGAVANYLKSEAAVPVWLIGTSMRTFSAASYVRKGQTVTGSLATSMTGASWAVASSPASTWNVTG